MNKDSNLIFEAYKKKLVNESQDQNYVPSLEEIKAHLTKSYKDDQAHYSNPERFKKEMDGLDKRATTIEKLIKAHKDWVDKWNSAPENSDRSPYTVWSSIYSELSDDYKDLNGFRFRTTPEKTSIIVLADTLLKTQEDLHSKWKESKKEEARVKSHAETLYLNPQKLEADVVKLVNDHADEAVSNIATIIERELIKSSEKPGDGFISQVAHMVLNTIINDKEIKLDPQERKALADELHGMYLTSRKKK
jgi:hypothetical protein